MLVFGLVCSSILAGPIKRGHAATVETADGSQLRGTVKFITEGAVVLETRFAGEIRIELDEVDRIDTEVPVLVETTGGERLEGILRWANDEVTLNAANGVRRLPGAALAAAWRPGTNSPLEEATEQAQDESAGPKWTGSIGFDVVGKSGNTDQLNAGLDLNVSLERPYDRIDLGLTYALAEDNGDKTADELIAKADYTNFFRDELGWYIREEFELDEFEDIDYRSTTAGGFSYQFMDTDAQRLELRGGLSFRYEDYQTDPRGSGSFVGLDFGLSHFWQFAAWGSISNELTYLPTFEDAGDFIISYDGGLEFPLAVSDRWTLRVGLSNYYVSEPSPGNEELDTSYYLRLLYKFK